jgi:hypothetical protein
VLLLDQSGHRNVRPANSKKAQDDGLRVLKLHDVASVGLEHFLNPEDRIELRLLNLLTPSQYGSMAPSRV